MKRFLILAILYYCTIIGKSYATAASDSLLQVYNALPKDTARLEILCRIIKIEQNNPKCIQYSDFLMKEALSLKDDKYASLAAYYHTIYYYNHNEQDSVGKWIAIMKPHIEKSGLWDYYFDAQRAQIDLYTNKKQYELSIIRANKMKQKALEMNNNYGLIVANQCLSNAYIESHRWTEGVKALEDAYKLLKNKENVMTRISVLTHLISVTKDIKDYAKQFKYMQELEVILKQYISENPLLKNGFADTFIFNELFYAHYYLNTNQYKKAYEHIIKSRNYLTEDTYFRYRILYFDALASYYRYAKQYQLASNNIDTTLTLLKQDYPHDYAEQLLKKARIWVDAEKSEIALPLYIRTLAIKDSTATVLSNNQMQQIKDNYNMDKTAINQDRQKNEFRLICLIVIAFILVVLFIFMRRASLVRKALKLSEAEIRETAKAVSKANEMKNRFLSNISYNIRTSLNNVVGFSQLIASEPDINESTREEYSRIINNSSEYLMKLVNDVLDLSRLEANMMKFQMQIYDAVTLCKEVCYMAQIKNEKNGIHVFFSTEIESLEINTDIGRITQAILSALTYQQDYKQERNIKFTLSKIDKFIYIRISNSPLADTSFTSQETHIRNDINRHLFKYFGGTYQINEETPEGPEGLFTYPIITKY